MQDDVVFHLTTTTNVSDAKMQRVLDARFPGAFICTQRASANARLRCKKEFRVGRLSVPPEVVQRRRAFTLAATKPNKSVDFFLGPYETSIKLYQKPRSAEEKLKMKNQELQRQLEELSMQFQSLQKEKRSDERLLEHVIVSNPVNPPSVPNSLLSSNKKRASNLSPKRKPSAKKRKQKPEGKPVNYGELEKEIMMRNASQPPKPYNNDPVKRRLDAFLQNMQGT